jgi:hypothetical protein
MGMFVHHSGGVINVNDGERLLFSSAFSALRAGLYVKQWHSVDMVNSWGRGMVIIHAPSLPSFPSAIIGV